jgi:FkbM family methyltransferase
MNPDELAARLYDQQLRMHAAQYSNMDHGRADSAAHLDVLFHRLIDLLEPALFVEAGAYRADASRRVKTDHPETRVVAFEANTYNHRAVSAEYDMNALGVEYLNLAVTEESGEVTFHLRTSVHGEPMRPVTGNSSLLRRIDQETAYETLTVPAVSLDGFFSDEIQAAQRSALWIDVEGASGPLLQGAAGFLAGCDLVMIEVEERPLWENQWLSIDVLTHFVAAGFQPVARDIEYENQFNLVLVGADFARRPDVLLSLELHDNYIVHHVGN